MQHSIGSGHVGRKIDRIGRHVEFRLRLENHAHIRLAFGEASALVAMQIIEDALKDAVGSDAHVSWVSSDCILVRLLDDRFLGTGPSSTLCQRWLAEFCLAMAVRPVAGDTGIFHVAVSGDWSATDLASGERQSGKEKPFVCGAISTADDWALAYRSDMGCVVKLFDLLRCKEAGLPRGRLIVRWQPIFDVSVAGEIFYYESLIGEMKDDGEVASLFPSILSAERVGLARILDRHMFDVIVAELEAFPDVALAVNISAQSVQQDAGWAAIQERLRHDPAVARRLIIEITETAALPQLADAAHFVRAMQHLGCRIALDDFGTGFASIRQLLALEPSIAKIDRFFVRRLASKNADTATFASLLGLAKSLGVHVVVEGIETAAQAEAVAELGGTLQQGWYWQTLTSARPWARAGATERTSAVS
ncbi:EAL domain-containing protein [Sphingopyxis sp.]|uniref:EAL domain-containing protein n=1 Tax=Sphingopyxis sp. TaxID=1908224 RepID=UPI003BAC0745